jgi:hypothetical protein
MDYEHGWAITGRHGIYCGWWHTRKEAIKAHTTALGKDWKACRMRGDRAAKIRINTL